MGVKKRKGRIKDNYDDLLDEVRDCYERGCTKFTLEMVISMLDVLEKRRLNQQLEELLAELHEEED